LRSAVAAVLAVLCCRAPRWCVREGEMRGRESPREALESGFRPEIAVKPRT